MAKKKKTVKKAKSSKDNKGTYTGVVYRSYEIVYDENDPGDRYGYINVLFEGTNREEYESYLEKTEKDNIDYPYEHYLDLLSKVKLEKKYSFSFKK